MIKSSCESVNKSVINSIQSHCVFSCNTETSKPSVNSLINHFKRYNTFVIHRGKASGYNNKMVLKVNS